MLDQAMRYAISFTPSAFDIRYNNNYVLVSPDDPADPILYLYEYTQDSSLVGTDI